MAPFTKGCSHHRHVGSPRRAQPEHGFGDVVRRAKPLHGRGHAQLFHGGQVCRVFGNGGLPNTTGAKGVHADAFAGKVDGGRFGQPDDACLRGRISRKAGPAHHAHDGRGIHDGATTVATHGGRFVFQAKPHAFQVDAQRTVPVFFGHLVDGWAARSDARIVEGEMQLAVGGDGGFHQAFHVAGNSNIGAHENGFTTRSGDGVCQFFTGWGADIGEHDIGTGCGKPQRGLLAEPRSRARDDDSRAGIVEVGHGGSPGWCPSLAAFAGWAQR